MNGYKYLSYNKERTVLAESDHPFKAKNCKTFFSNTNINLGQKVPNKKKNPKEMKIAFVCNWNVACGISTYSKFLIDSIKPFVKEIMIFSECGEPISEDAENVIRCWTRGESLKNLSKKIKEYNPDFVNIQHEYGIFPNACHFLNFLYTLEKIPYSVTLHSVYEHLDKTICTSAIKSIIVHSQEAKNVLLELGHKNEITIIPHGCFDFDHGELWNIFKNPYTILQFGFGFRYKGVERALEAISILKKTDKKFKDIFYTYLCSESQHNSNIHNEYLKDLNEKIKELDIEENVSIIRGYQDEKIINNYIRTAKLSIFPYKVDPENTVYGASGAIRIAMANKVPIIASESHLFDDLNEIIPRPKSSVDLAKEIDKIFSDGNYRINLINNIKKHTKENSWEESARLYIESFQETRNFF